MHSKGDSRRQLRKASWNYLHELGKILYFRNDHPIPHDSIILKPNWLAKAISLILTDKGIQDRSGILVDSDLARIWTVDEDEQSYDIASHTLFLRLMERFNLCYQIKSQHKTYYFIPQLLPPHPPSSLPNWTAKEMKAGKVNVEIIYHLDLVPTDIMNWFIVRTHQYTCSMHWHNGVVLSYQDHLARVELFSKRKQLHIEVWGAEPYTFFVLLKETMDLNFGSLKDYTLGKKSLVSAIDIREQCYLAWKFTVINKISSNASIKVSKPFSAERVFAASLSANYSMGII